MTGDVLNACLLWDIDGTLVAHAPARRDRHAHAVRVVLDVDAQPVQLGTGKTDRQLVAEIIGAHMEPDDATIEAALDALDAITTADLGLTPSTPIPGVADILAATARSQTPQLLLTGNTPLRAELKVRTAGLDQYFAFQDGFYGDQHATRFELVEQAAGVFTGAAIAWTIIIGDTPLDIAAARSVGFPVIAVATGSSPFEELADHQPDALLRDFGGGPAAFMDAVHVALRD